jgi:ABC-type lipoprotein export system ATPase subunit
LLNLCAGFAHPSSGELIVLGTPFGTLSHGKLARLRRRSIGLVRQHYHRALPAELTTEEIVALPLRLLGRYGPPERRRVALLLRRAGLERQARSRPVELSGGEQQRVAVCAAVVKRPQLLLADEPTGELDARSTAAVIDLLLELVTESGAAALLVTHDPAVTLAAERTIHIRDGRLAAEGTTRPTLVVDEQGWLRLPRRLREEAGLRERVRAQATWGRIELIAEHPESPRPRTGATGADARPAATEKRYGTEIALERVEKRYGDQVVVAGLSCTFGPEQVHVVAGPSGSGKTTLLNLIAVLDVPDAGELWVGGERVDGLGADDAARWRQRTVGYLSQHSTLVGFLSAIENVMLGLNLRGWREEEARRRAERWLDWVGLGKLGQRRADQLSGGEQRRVALARALAPGPRVLLADEPTAHLDRVSGRLVIRLLQDAARESGTTVVAGSHDPDLVAAADTRLALGSHEVNASSPAGRPHAKDERRRREDRRND